MARRASRPLSALAAALAGIAAAALFLGVGDLIAVLVDPAASPFFVLGATVVDHTPNWLKDSAIRWFGANDKLALSITMAVVMTLAAAAIGVLARRRPAAGATILAALGLGVAGAALLRPSATPWFAAPSVVATAAAVLALLALVTRRAVPAARRPDGRAGREVGRPAPEEPHALALPPAKPDRDQPGAPPSDAQADRIGQGAPPPPGRPRRAFLCTLAAVAAGAAAAGAAGRSLGSRLHDIAADRAAFVLPRASAAPPVAPGTDLRLPGLTPFLTANEDFYRVDTALQLPALTRANWRLRIHGMVDREIRLDFDELSARTAVESIVTLTCVSNEVGGDLAGTARWTGYRLTDLLAEAGPAPGADMVLSRSIDGFTASTPLAALLGNPDALLAVGMNGTPLPVTHGYPARMIVPGLYGYVSATKWVVDLEVTRFDRAEAYWTRRGWSPRAPIETASRIDVPAAFATLPAGPVTVAGVAWAQTRGIAAVEVQVDDGPWQPATLAAAYSLDTWRQWSFAWQATPGTHTLRVRATDSTGRPQTPDRTPPFPDGATGHHTRVLTIR
ncbi:molybdopterin-dependent oxidoreductase [Nocardia thailandica]|uniref:molybdopterin-dependent oxidoreductase n=1 Tax=Nocardia thailandica TaxID=257275 RepID=UPI0002DD40A7|nr:molybdopterin-dependent oxidoreductase [Nocardia thailandica]